MENPNAPYNLQTDEVTVLESQPSASSGTWKPFMNEHILPIPCIKNPLLEQLNQLIRQWYGLRWKLTQPLLHSVPILGPRYGIKYGDLCFTFPLAIGLTVLGAALMIADKVSGSGTPPTIGMALVFVFACHNSIFTLLTGIPFERALFYHKLAAYVTTITGFFHMVAYINVGPEEDDGAIPATKFTLFSTDYTNDALTGLVLQGAFVLLFLFSLGFVRRYLFEFFYRTHWLLVLVAIGFAFAHGAGGIVAGMAFWVVDVVYRYFFQAFHFNTRTAQLDRLPSKVMRLSFSKERFQYKSGQYMFICVPSLSTVEWHPFSISSAPHEERVTIHIRVLGNWTEKLYQLAAEDTVDLRVFMEGPYGEPGVDVDGDTYDSFLMISGGIGITPMQSITNDLLHQYQCGRPLRKIWFVWSVRDRYMIDAMYNKAAVSNRLPLSFVPDGFEQHSPNSEDVLYTEFYLTKARGQEARESANIHPEVQACLRFERPPLDAIITEMANIAKSSRKRVAVLVCGPAGMVTDVHRICQQTTTKDIQFDVHSETFDF